LTGESVTNKKQTNK